ncbi:MAG: hypothetical protein M3O50_16505 [Myxococcota bacterium]|nr:hypothetical protein [Myxococcota bacterium]
MHLLPVRTGATRSIVGLAVLTCVPAALSSGCIYITVPDHGPAPETTVPTMYPGQTQVSSADSGTDQANSPDYWLDFGGYVVKEDMAHVVQSTTGAVKLMAGRHLGEAYVVDTHQDLGWSFGAVDAVYTAGAPAPLGAIMSELGLVGATLPTLRNVIILHTQNGVRSYEVLRVTFNASR